MNKLYGILPAGLMFFTTAAGQTLPNLQSVTENGNTTDKQIQINAITTQGSRFTVKGYNLGYFDLSNNSNNSINLSYLRSDGTNVFSIDGHTMNTYFGGNIGLGVSAPAYKLDVNGNIRTTGTYATDRGPQSPGFAIRNASGVLRWALGGFGTEAGSNTGYDYSIFRYNDAGSNVGIVDFIIQRSTGNIGLGYSAPAYKLDVNGVAKFGASLIIGTGINQGFYHDASNGAYRAMNNGNNGFYFQNYAGAVTTMFVGLNGNYANRVGIGTLQPQSELAVNGTITAKRLKVTLTGWPDFVFDSSYRLKPLRQIEQFIQENHHLPDVPSAATVGKEGVDVGENQALLLKKIEELTLYIIMQNKRLDDQQKEITELKAKIK